MLNFAAPTELIASALRACRRHFIGVAAFSALLNLLFLVPMLYMLQVYDRVIPTRGGLTLFFLTLVLLFGLITLALLDFVRSRLLVRASIRLDRQLAGVMLDTSLARRDKTFDAVARQSMREFDTLRQALTGPAIIALCDAPWTPIYILVCLVIHPFIGLLVLVGAVLLAVIAYRNQQVIGEPLQRANEAAARAYASQEQVLAGAENVRALGMRRAMVRRHLAERNLMTTQQTFASLASSRYVTISKFLRLALQSMALGLGAWLAINNSISAGAVFASSFLAGRALQPVEQLLSSWRSVVNARTAYEKLNSLLGAREAETALTQLPPPEGRLDAKQLWVAKPAGDGAILANVSLELKPGEVIAVVGPSGAGKSTLLRLLAGAGRPDRGIIRIDHANMLDWDPERLAPFIGYLPQDVSLFAGTVKENIARFQQGSDGDMSEIDARVIAAAKYCQAHELILGLPNGYDSPLGWGGRGLSAGQAQRIALARALYGDPPIVLLDEPNAHLDAAGESQLIETLVALRSRNAGVVVVAHRMGVLAAVDKILVMRDGQVEAFGTRDEIMARLGGTSATPIEAPGQAGGQKKAS
ncbi:type I secretion system permease/ATPase [Sphingomonas sp. NSE70-1]|uniref:Type I secretion system permease/ATPase n=1 Tax=Sphingomonas caseinilyticus TaxID=2908205 RepID=A0ABT0RUH4_9SPHN|nr:type I secretion system permease/ATPase [Sphingomonas caseinilyticus]MCL6698606.1 type I secretion system permease/ATPase [Sphingomonas caseinilyticus]